MRKQTWLGLGLVALGAGIVVYAVLGPLVLDVIRFRTSPSGLAQIRGGDLAALAVVAPACFMTGALALRGHAAAPVLALAPAGYASYTYSQLLLGNEYLRLPGNVERFFPFLLALLTTGLAVAVLALFSIDARHLPEPTLLMRRASGILLLVIATFIVVGIHLRSLLDAMSAHPANQAYLDAPTAFWVIKVEDLGLLAPAAMVVGIGLLRSATWARVPAYAILGGYALLGTSVAGMAWTMQLTGDPDASVVLVAVSTLLAAALVAFAGVLYRPLLTSRPAARLAAAERTPVQPLAVPGKRRASAHSA